MSTEGADGRRASVSKEVVAGARRPGLTSAVRHLLGRRVLGAYAFTIAGATLLGAIELGIAFFLQLFLRSLGILAADAGGASFVRFLPTTPHAIALALCVIAATRALGQYLVNQSSVVATESLNSRMRRLIAYDMLLHPSRRFVPASEVNARLSDTFHRAAQACYWAANLASGSVQIAIVGIVMTLTAPRESALALAGLLAVGLFVLRINRRIRVETRDIPDEHRAIASGIQRVARNAFLVRVLHTEHREHSSFVRSITAVERKSIRASALANLATALIPFLGTILLTTVVVVSQRVLRSPGITLLSFLYLFVRFVQNVATAVTSLSAINQYWPQFREAMTYFGAFTTEDLDRAMLPSAAGRPLPSQAQPPRPPRIELDGVGFRFVGSPHPVFQDLTADVAAGSQFAIVGPSGCGKSTLLSLVLGVASPTAGRISIDGTSPADYFARPDVRVGYVGAEPFLIAGTIRENLLYGCPRAVSEAEIADALSRAHLRETVAALPEGLEHRLNENGAGLSAGQQQRLCLARALLTEPDLLVLDEASANLDADTEREITESIRSLAGRCTTIVVSHRPGLLRHADRVLSLGAAHAVNVAVRPASEDPGAGGPVAHGTDLDAGARA